MEKYDPKAIETKWRTEWEKQKIYEPDIAKAKKPFYNLMMFPYPSAEGLHVGNMYAFTGSDIYGRFMRMKQHDVFEPIGLDAFGIHSENFALKTNTHPLELSKQTEANFYRQLHLIGNGYAWDYKLETNKPEYYKWTQWVFLQLYKKGLAEKRQAPVNWCPSCLTVLSDEQVIDGKCERCASEVVIKNLDQWFFKITAYAERLLKNLEWIDWDQSVKAMQKNWIGKKNGTEITFIAKNRSNKSIDIKVFTTRPDTIFGVTAIILSPNSSLLHQILSNETNKELERYIHGYELRTKKVGNAQTRVKTGVKTSYLAANPISGELIPVWVSDYVIGTYGTGAIMLVPAHDQRDYDFANKFGIEIRTVVEPKNPKTPEKAHPFDKICPINKNEAFEEYGVLVNSGSFTGLPSAKGSEKIVSYLESIGKGEKSTSYHLRDWLISRQRYWGPPIPIIYCQHCGTVPVPEEQLPVELPYIEDFRPTGTGKSPLASHPEFYNVKCPKCNKNAQRETDVSDTFLDSAWYFLRYPSVRLTNKAFDKELTKKWLPVDMYIGGKEHTVLHLLYSRFITMVLYDLGLLTFEEPYIVFRAHGLLIKNGAKISKSKGNVINPDDFIEKYGSDTFRAYLMFIGPFNEGGDFRDTGIIGVHRFLNKVWTLASNYLAQNANSSTVSESAIVDKTVKKVSEDIEKLRYNTAIAAIMELTNSLLKEKHVSERSMKAVLQLLAPFAPFITEDLWHRIGQRTSIHISSWPTYSEASMSKQFAEIVIQVNGKTRGKVHAGMNESQAVIEAQAKALPNISQHLENRKVKRIIYIPNKLINIVA